MRSRFLFSFLVLAACGGATSTVSSDGGGGSSGGSSGGTGDAAVPPPTAPQVRDAGTPVCSTDADCNGIVMDSLAGKCIQGFCLCRDGMFVQPNGKCAPTAPPDCQSQGGTCHQNPATCPSGMVHADNGTDMSCGDLVAAVCCFQARQCIGPDLVCCGPTDSSDPPICENGWLACPPGDAPGIRGKTFCG